MIKDMENQKKVLLSLLSTPAESLPLDTTPPSDYNIKPATTSAYLRQMETAGRYGHPPNRLDTEYASYIEDKGAPRLNSALHLNAEGYFSQTAHEVSQSCRYGTHLRVTMLTINAWGGCVDSPSVRSCPFLAPFTSLHSLHSIHFTPYTPRVVEVVA